MPLLRRNATHADLDPDQIFLDDRNMPGFDVDQFEGRIETPIGRNTIVGLGIVFALIGTIVLLRVGLLQIKEGAAYAERSENNRLEYQILFSERGRIKDRNGALLAWNVPSPEELGFSLRAYIERGGFGHILGFLHYPARDKSGVYYRNDYEARSGVEEFYDTRLSGKKGLRIIETDALGNIVSSNTIDPPVPGNDLVLAIDARIQEALYRIVAEVARDQDYLGGAGAIMDIYSGDLLALVSYPEFNPNVMTAGDDREQIAAWNADKRTPFLNRAIAGLYTPGSIVKPIFAVGALTEGIISAGTPIVSKGYIEVPNPYVPDKPSRFNDWKAHGVLDMRRAIAVSSNVYFYEIAGGYESQRGLGIVNLEKYARLFGYGTTTGIDLFGEVAGTIPNREWKAAHFPDDPIWRLGDTYFTGIGQYGMQATVLQALVEAAVIASGGTAITPRLSLERATSSRHLPIPAPHFSVVREGMRMAVTEGTANVLNIPEVAIAAKTGTAELGVSKTRVNSWVIGFFPYEHPRYAFAIVMDRGVRGNTTNASVVAARFIQWMGAHTPEYLRQDK